MYTNLLYYGGSFNLRINKVKYINVSEAINSTSHYWIGSKARHRGQITFIYRRNIYAPDYIPTNYPVEVGLLYIYKILLVIGKKLCKYKTKIQKND